jgi:hypothetical protein
MKEIFSSLSGEWKRLTAFEKVFGAIVVTFMFVLFTGQAIYSAAISGTNVAAKVAPFDTADTYPSHDARYGKGGLVQFQTTSQCRLISVQRRYTGLMCYAAATDSWRYLKNGTANTNWQKAPVIPVLGVDYFDGRPGPPPLFCSISGGTRAITYDQTGLNPSPSMRAFFARLWNGNSIVAALRQIWYTATGRVLVSGTATTASFTPSVFSSFSASKSNNYVAVQLTYSASAANGGKRYCIASTPISITKQGTTGLQGPQGADATVAEPNVMGAFSTSRSNNPFRLRANSVNPQSKLEFRDINGNLQAYIYSNGRMTFRNHSANATLMQYSTGRQGNSLSLLNRAGYQRVKMLNDGTVRILNSLGYLWLELHGDNREVTHYRGNGTTVAFRVYSSGRWIGGEGLPASTIKQIMYATPGGFRGYTTAAGGGGGSGAYPGGTVNRQLQFRNSATTFGGAAFMRYTAVARSGSTVTQDGIINGSNLPLVIFNAARRAVFAIRSSGAVIIGGT